MDVHWDIPPLESRCDPYISADERELCGPCKPNQILTCEEEAILAKMREIKSTVRDISDRMARVKALEGGASTEAILREKYLEWHELSTQLDELRGHWTEGRNRLEEAIERKLILLGHREIS